MKKKKGLEISADGSLTLPAEDASTQTVVVYGGKGKGKTNFGTVLAEELYRNALKFSALDPYGVMWGLRHGQAKSEKGLEILILGGVHADRDQLAFLSDQSATSSGYANNLGALRTLGFLAYPAKGRVGLTEAGRAIAVIEEVPASSSELHAIVERKLSPTRWRIIATLIQAYPREVERAELAELSNQSATSSGYANNLGALRSLGLLDYPSKGSVVATSALFLDER